MTTCQLCSLILVLVGGIAMLLGGVDPLEGSLLILPGSGRITLGLCVGKAERRALRYWVRVFILIAVGVGALFGLSAVGGIGGTTGLSMGWRILILPYPVGWLMGLVSAISALIQCSQAKGQRAYG